MLDLAPILKRLAGVSSCPWHEIDGYIFDAKGNTIGLAMPNPYKDCSGENNAAFFGNAPQDVWDLIKEVMKLRKQVERVEDE